MPIWALPLIFQDKNFIFECLLFGLRDRGLLILLLPDVSPASVAGIFRGLAPGLLLGVSQAKHQGVSLSPKGKHSNINADCESLNQYIKILT